jgi:hypothetical protein
MTGRQVPDPSKSRICPVVIAGAPTGNYLCSIEGACVLQASTLPEFFADALPRYSWTIDCVFIDETWAKTNMVRTYGWGPRGQRCPSQIKSGHR